ncbi:MAG: type II toxin-antitoxin system Phd/YefM family antitoxin [Clostridia bacterium]|nr:type II toxin-antitoxin system Phd/YefM family antitoxin [Clostridia bacterium]
MNLSKVLNQLIPITQFNKGKASQLFSRVQEGETLIVMKNNVAVAVVISPEEYSIIERFKNKDNYTENEYD